MNAQDLDRMSELANIGAGHAAGAFSVLAQREIRMKVPRVVPIENTDSAGDVDWTTGVFFEFEGCLNAIVGILFHAPASEAVVRRVVGISEGELPPHCIESALMEVGNILASHVASAIADTLGERLLPSIPTLAMNFAEAELMTLVRHREGAHPIRIECELSDGAGDLGGLLVLIPEDLAAA